MIVGMAMPKREPIRGEQLRGGKYFRKILPLLDHLHDHATQRDRAGNRQLHYDQYVALQLLFFFNPIVTSMRGLVQTGRLAEGAQDARRDAHQPGQLFGGRVRL